MKKTCIIMCDERFWCLKIGCCQQTSHYFRLVYLKNASQYVKLLNITFTLIFSKQHEQCWYSFLECKIRSTCRDHYMQNDIQKHDMYSEIDMCCSYMALKHVKDTSYAWGQKETLLVHLQGDQKVRDSGFKTWEFWLKNHDWKINRIINQMSLFGLLQSRLANLKIEAY